MSTPLTPGPSSILGNSGLGHLGLPVQGRRCYRGGDPPVCGTYKSVEGKSLGSQPSSPTSHPHSPTPYGMGSTLEHARLRRVVGDPEELP